MYRICQPNHKIWICLIYISLVLINTCDSGPVGETILTEVTTLANDGLGVAAFQQYLDNSVTFVNKKLDASTLAKQVAESMSAKLNVRIQALNDLNNLFQAIYGSASTLNPYTQCCTVRVQEKDSHLNATVNYNEWCTLGKHLSTATEFLPSTILDHVKNQYNKALGIKYAYFASAQGVLFNYPALKVCQEDYDPRFRPWYVETSTPQPKDLVLVIDRSQSMSALFSVQSLLQIAQDAANTVIDTVNPYDRIGVVAFSTEAEVPSGIGCYQTQLARATPQNRAYMKSFINGLVAEGDTHYTKALTKAFRYFTSTTAVANDHRGREQVILFLTDGLPSETNHSDIYDLVATENHKLGNNVTILTYGLGIISAADVLEKMAKQVNTDPAYGNITEGIYTPVTNPSNLRSTMASYYEHFKHQVAAQVTISVPYVDSFGSGLIVSMCLPTNYQGQLKGVTCMDLSVEDMMSEIIYFNEGESSYGFIIDSTARVLAHPLVVFPLQVTNNPYFIYLPTLEKVTGIQEITNSMTSGGNGTKVIAMQQIYARGDVELEGTYRANYEATYSWYPVVGTDYSVCLVITKDDKKTSIQWTAPYPTTFVYTRLDLSNRTKCKHFFRDSIRDTDMVSFAARCFLDPYLHLYTNETRNTVDSYKLYFTGGSQSNPRFKDGIRETVAATAKFTELMQSRSSFNAYWRFISTENGVHRTFPAVEVPSPYDATQTTWYVRAKANKGLLTISPPHKAVAGAGPVITLSTVIYEGNSVAQHTPNDKTFGVMGMHFTMEYFYNLTIAEVALCKRSYHVCFVVDSSGYIIVHEQQFDYTNSYYGSVISRRLHISQYEPSVTTSLMVRYIMVSDACMETDTLKKNTFWKIYSDVDVVDTKFELYPVRNTNVYLIVRKTSDRTYPVSACSACPSRTYSFYRKLCSNMTKCFCPCFNSSSTDVYKHCLAEFDFSSDTIKPCTPKLRDISFSTNYTSQLQSCYNFNCNTTQKRSQSKCNFDVGCQWCKYNYTGRRITRFCHNITTCPSGRLTKEFVRNAQKTDSEGGSLYWWLFGPGIGLVILILVAVFCVCCTADGPKATVSPENPAITDNGSANTRNRLTRSTTAGNQPSTLSGNNGATGSTESNTKGARRKKKKKKKTPPENDTIKLDENDRPTTPDYSNRPTTSDNSRRPTAPDNNIRPIPGDHYNRLITEDFGEKPILVDEYVRPRTEDRNNRRRRQEFDNWPVPSAPLPAIERGDTDILQDGLGERMYGGREAPPAYFELYPNEQ